MVRHFRFAAQIHNVVLSEKLELRTKKPPDESEKKRVKKLA